MGVASRCSTMAKPMDNMQMDKDKMAKPMDNMPYSEFNNWLASPTFTGPVGIIAKLYLKEGQRDEFLKIMEDSVAFTKLEAGVLVYKVNEDAMDPLVFWLTEEWSSVKDLANHCSSTNYAGISERAGKVLLEEEYSCQLSLYKLCNTPLLSI